MKTVSPVLALRLIANKKQGAADLEAQYQRRRKTANRRRGPVTNHTSRPLRFISEARDFELKSLKS